MPNESRDVQVPRNIKPIPVRGKIALAESEVLETPTGLSNNFLTRNMANVGALISTAAGGLYWSEMLGGAVHGDTQRLILGTIGAGLSLAIAEFNIRIQAK